jgi:CubicO group peptidase (beta-lactamase class C family)
MKRTGFIIIFLFFFAFLSAQSAHKPAYQQLQEYEGVYEFMNHSTLQIATSPRDTLLYAIVNKSQYPLRALSKDVFSNALNDSVVFYRDHSGAVNGYRVDGNTFKLLSLQVSFPRQMWYPRLNKFYQYHPPEGLKDGLDVGNVIHSGLDSELLNKMMQQIIAGVYPNVHSILIIKDSKLVFEEYFYDYTKDSLQELRSATKSFISALTGIAIHDGYIKSKDEKVLSYFPEYTLQNMSPLKGKISIENLLTNQSGLDCDISNEQSEGNETKMDYSDDWVKFTLDLPVIDTPGRIGRYCSGNPITIGRVIEKATGQPLPEFANKNLFNSLGISSFKWNFKPDKSNAEDYCQLYLTPREMAKFGLLYLDGGRWNGKQLVPAEWIKESFEKHSVVEGVDYGYLWWLKYLDAGDVRYYAKVAQGNGGQKIYVWPKQNMVVVITGGNYNSQSPDDELMEKYILPAFNGK